MNIVLRLIAVALALVFLARAFMPIFQAVRAFYRAWPEVEWWKRILGLILFLPHVGILCCLIPWFKCYGFSGAETNYHCAGMSCSDLIMASAVLGIFILPVPAYLCTQLALRIFRTQYV